MNSFSASATHTVACSVTMNINKSIVNEFTNDLYLKAGATMTIHKYYE